MIGSLEVIDKNQLTSAIAESSGFVGGVGLESGLPMLSSRITLAVGLAAALVAIGAAAQFSRCEDPTAGVESAITEAPEVKVDPTFARLLRYARVAARHRMTGLASYYSTSLEGTLTANGERYHNKRLSAAHLTLPLGSWVEIRSVATGKKVRLRVNDRGPYSKFTIDLSQAAARAIGVDVAENRSVEFRIIALPGEKPLRNDER